MNPPVLKDSVLEAGELIGSYEIIEPIGRGGMGEVFLARHKTIPGRKAAIKVSVARAKTSQAIADFYNEIDLMSRVRHPNVVTLYDAGQRDDGTFWMALEYIEGRPLNDLVRDEGRLLIEDALLIASEIADGVGAAHLIGILHRDIKPQNVIVTPDDQVKVVDFGIAKLAREGGSIHGPATTEDGYVKGTIAYLAPENLMRVPGVKPDARQDIFALGVLLYVLLTGRHPHEDEDGTLPRNEILAQRILMLKETPIPKILHGFPDDVWFVVQRMLMKAPKDRYASMDEVASALRRCRNTFLAGQGGAVSQLRSIASRRAARSRSTAAALSGDPPPTEVDSAPRRGGTVMNRPAEPQEMADLSHFIAQREAAKGEAKKKAQAAPILAPPIPPDPSLEPTELASPTPNTPTPLSASTEILATEITATATPDLGSRPDPQKRTQPIATAQSPIAALGPNDEIPPGMSPEAFLRAKQAHERLLRQRAERQAAAGISPDPPAYTPPPAAAPAPDPALKRTLLIRRVAFACIFLWIVFLTVFLLATR